MLSALLLTFFAVPATHAWAAEITPTAISVSVDRSSVTSTWLETVNTTLTFTTPNNAVAGDTMTLTLPQILADWPASFQITDGDGGPVVYEVTISDTSPAVATFTLTQAGAAIDNLQVTAVFGADVGKSPGGTYPLVYKVGSSGELISAGNLVVNEPKVTVPTKAAKGGWFADTSNQCRTETKDCIVYQIGSPAAAKGTMTIEDSAQSTWEHSCGIIVVQVVTVNAGGSLTYSRKADVTPGTAGYTCSADKLSLTYDLDPLNLAANQSVAFQLRASAIAPGGVGLVKYANTATVTVNDVTTTPGKTVMSSYVGGSATGDSVSIIKRDEQGHDANTTSEAVDLSTGSTGLDFTIVNNGTTNLTNITVSDKVTSGSGTVSDLTCDFSALGGPKSGVTWNGPFAPKASFTCTAKLTGVSASHTDSATVTATGNGDVSDTDDYNAKNAPMNLVLAKELTSKAPFSVGDEVMFTLTPSNDKERDAEAGWSVTDILPDGLTLTGMSGDGYDCTDNTCVAKDALAAGATGKPIIVTATIDADATGTLHNVAYVEPHDGDVDETNPLEKPTKSTNTDDTPTDNDAQADLTITSPVKSASPTATETSPGPVRSESPTATQSPTEASATGSSPTASETPTASDEPSDDESGSFLADTGSGLGLGGLLGALTLVGLGTAVVLRKRVN